MDGSQCPYEQSLPSLQVVACISVRWSHRPPRRYSQRPLPRASDLSRSQQRSGKPPEDQPLQSGLFALLERESDADVLVVLIA